jgi:hypothetical protein
MYKSDGSKWIEIQYNVVTRTRTPFAAQSSEQRRISFIFSRHRIAAVWFRVGNETEWTFTDYS